MNLKIAFEKKTVEIISLFLPDILFFLRIPNPLSTWEAAPLLPLLFEFDVDGFSSCTLFDPDPPVAPPEEFAPEATAEEDDELAVPVAVVILP